MANPTTAMEKFKQGAAGILGMMYPADLMSAPESHYVTFSAFRRTPVLMSNDGDASPTSKNMEAIGGVVMLYIPEGISAQYGTSWNQKELGISGQSILDSLNGSSRDAALASMSSMDGVGGEIAKRAAAEAAGSFVGLNSGVDLLNLGSRSLANSNPRMLFEGVGFRQFNFNYSFVPRNANESLAVRNIIHYFKLYMHPTLTGAQINYPCEFNIAYNGNQFLHNFKPAALVDLKVEYATNGVWSSFQRTSAPTEVRMSLSFQETEFITRADVMNENV